MKNEMKNGRSKENETKRITTVKTTTKSAHVEKKEEEKRYKYYKSLRGCNDGK